MTGWDAGDLPLYQETLFRFFHGKRLFFTGGTGFFGQWLVRTLLEMIRCFGLRLAMTLLTRSPERLRGALPDIAGHPDVTVLAGDVRSFAFPEGTFSCVIHAAAEASAALNREAPLAMYDTIVTGTRRVLEFCRQAGTKRMLFVSSGAVYGKQPATVPHVPETYAGSPDPLAPGNAYAEGKRAGEFLCAAFAAANDLEIPIARPFAFLGPGLPLERHFAAGNFLADALAGRPLAVNGDGTPYRSYMYPTDLTAWLLTILAKGQSGRAYNVGSDEAVTIGELARQIAGQAGGLSVVIAKKPDPDRPPERYVPCVDRARDELGLCRHVGLSEAISRTLTVLRGQMDSAVCRS